LAALSEPDRFATKIEILSRNLSILAKNRTSANAVIICFNGLRKFFS
jgi:hypothetical protein